MTTWQAIAAFAVWVFLSIGLTVVWDSYNDPD